MKVVNGYKYINGVWAKFYNYDKVSNMLSNLFSDTDKEQYTPLELPVSFVLAPQRQLRVSTFYHDSLKAWKYYSHHITRFPLDLRAHIQRLFLVLDAGMATELLAGAMQDLFIALSEKGEDLRKQMLEVVKPSLATKDIAHFETWLLTGERQNFEYKVGSVLDQGLPCNAQKLVVPVQVEEKTVSYGNAIEEAQACLEYGQVEEAQKILEDELTRDINNIDVAQELLNIYQYIRDRNAFDTTTEKLLDAGVELSEGWKQVQKESQEWQ